MNGSDGAALKEILDLSQSSPDRSRFRGDTLDFLARSVGYSWAFFRERSPHGDGWSGGHFEARGFSESDLVILRQGDLTFAAELAPVYESARSRGGVAVDSEVLGGRMRDLRYYREVMRPLGGKQTLLCYLVLRGRPLGLLMLGRDGSAGFHERELGRMRLLGSAISTALASFPADEPALEAAHGRLSPREREIVSFLCLGYTNVEIALALGISRYTVRNQLGVLFHKLEVTTRAELVGRWLGR